MATIALELVPTSIGKGQAVVSERTAKVKGLLKSSGLARRINTLLLPQIVPEDPDRPVAIEDKMDPLDFSKLLSADFSTSFILTQVTVFTPPKELEARVDALQQAGIERVVFVGVPRMINRPIIGPQPTEALNAFRTQIPSRGAILIPTRSEEKERLSYKLESGATFALTQMLFSDQIVGFLNSMANTAHRPEIILSFSYVPNLESKVGLIRWLIRDETAPAVSQELAHVEELAALPFKEKMARTVEFYRRILEQADGLGFPLGVHFECPYGVSEPALETFNAMLDVWSPS